jgi:hypothetical protein
VSAVPEIAGDVNAYEFYVEVVLHFRCDACGAILDCPVLDSDEDAPNPPWSTREGARGRSLGWWVPPLAADGSLEPTCFCPACAQERGLIVPHDQAI